MEVDEIKCEPAEYETNLMDLSDCIDDRERTASFENERDEPSTSCKPGLSRCNSFQTPPEGWTLVDQTSSQEETEDSDAEEEDEVLEQGEMVEHNYSSLRVKRRVVEMDFGSHGRDLAELEELVSRSNSVGALGLSYREARGPTCSPLLPSRVERVEVGSVAYKAGVKVGELVYPLTKDKPRHMEVLSDSMSLLVQEGEEVAVDEEASSSTITCEEQVDVGVDEPVDGIHQSLCNLAANLTDHQLKKLTPDSRLSPHEIPMIYDGSLEDPKLFQGLDVRLTPIKYLSQENANYLSDIKERRLKRSKENENQKYTTYTCFECGRSFSTKNSREIWRNHVSKNRCIKKGPFCRKPKPVPIPPPTPIPVPIQTKSTRDFLGISSMPGQFVDSFTAMSPAEKIRYVQKLHFEMDLLRQRASHFHHQRSKRFKNNGSQTIIPHPEESGQEPDISKYINKDNVKNRDNLLNIIERQGATLTKLEAQVKGLTDQRMLSSIHFHNENKCEQVLSENISFCLTSTYESDCFIKKDNFISFLLQKVAKHESIDAKSIVKEYKEVSGYSGEDSSLVLTHKARVNKNREIVRLQRLQAELEKRTEKLDGAIKDKSKELGDMEYMRVMKIRSMQKIDQGKSVLKPVPTITKRTQTGDDRIGIGYLFPRSGGNPRSTKGKVDKDNPHPFYPPPPFSDFCLIAMAMKKYSHQGQGHSFREIVNFIVTNFPGFLTEKSYNSLKYSLLSGHPFKQFDDNTFGPKYLDSLKLYKKILHVMRDSRKMVMASMRYPSRADSLISGWWADNLVPEIIEEPVEDPLQIDNNENVASLASESEDFLKIEEVVHLAADAEVYLANEEVNFEDSEVHLADSVGHSENSEGSHSGDSEEVPLTDSEEVHLANNEDVNLVNEGQVHLADDNQPVIKMEFSSSEENWHSEDMKTS